MGPSNHFIESGLPSFVKKCGRFFVRAMPCTSTHAHTVSAMHMSFVRAITQRPAQTSVHTLRVQSTMILCGHARTCMHTHTHTHFGCIHIELERACMHALRVQRTFIVREQCPAQARVHTHKLNAGASIIQLCIASELQTTYTSNCRAKARIAGNFVVDPSS